MLEIGSIAGTGRYIPNLKCLEPRRGIARDDVGLGKAGVLFNLTSKSQGWIYVYIIISQCYADVGEI